LKLTDNTRIENAHTVQKQPFIWFMLLNLQLLAGQNRNGCVWVVTLHPAGLPIITKIEPFLV